MPHLGNLYNLTSLAVDHLQKMASIFPNCHHQLGMNLQRRHCHRHYQCRQQFATEGVTSTIIHPQKTSKNSKFGHQKKKLSTKFFQKKLPANIDYKGYHAYIDETLPQESPALYGLHLNAEIGFLTTLSDSLFRVVHDLQPRNSAGRSQSGSTREEAVEGTVEELTEKLPDPFNMAELKQKEEIKTACTVVCMQEFERMNSLTQEIRR